MASSIATAECARAAHRRRNRAYWRTLRRPPATDAPSQRSGLPARDRTDLKEGLFPGGDVVRQWCVRRFVREILLAREEPYERAALSSRVVTYGAPQHRIGGLQCVEDGALRHRALHVERDLVADVKGTVTRS